jgi:hypothetical protein
VVSWLARMCFALAGIGVMVLGGYFFKLSWDTPGGQPEPVSMGDQGPTLRELIERIPQRHQAPTALLTDPLASADPAREASQAAMIAIGPGSERLEIRVGGQILGGTPYVGQLHCKPGDPVQLELVSASGEVQHFTRTCMQEIRVEPR